MTTANVYTLISRPPNLASRPIAVIADVLRRISLDVDRINTGGDVTPKAIEELSSQLVCALSGLMTRRNIVERFFSLEERLSQLFATWASVREQHRHVLSLTNTDLNSRKAVLVRFIARTPCETEQQKEAVALLRQLKPLIREATAVGIDIKNLSEERQVLDELMSLASKSLSFVAQILPRVLSTTKHD